jgi:type II secretory pathway component PulC
MSIRIARRGIASSSLLALVLACRPEPRGGESLLEGEGEGERLIGEDTEVETQPQPARPPGAIYRSELRRATQDGSAAYLLGQLRPEPYRPQGRFEGWIITAVWPGDPELCEPGCDLQIGDVILAVNGSKLERPEDLADAMSRLDSLETLELRGMRDGQYFERSHPILPDP